MNLSTELKLHYSTHSSLFKAFLVLSPQAEKKIQARKRKEKKINIPNVSKIECLSQ